MTRDAVREFVYDISHPNVLGEVYYQLDSPDDQIKQWVRTAPPRTLELLIECVGHPDPDDHSPDRDSDWKLAIEFILVAWASYNPGFVLPRVGEMLDRKEHREVALYALAALARPAVYPYAAPWADRISELSDTEVVWLIDALGECKVPEGRALLTVIKQRIPSTMPEALAELVVYGVTD